MRIQSHNTLYELTEADYNSDPAQLAFWLFNDYYNRFSTDIQKAVAGTFISNFIRKYYNREMWHKNKNVFRSSLYYDLNKYFEYLANVTDEYTRLAVASITLDETINRERTDEGHKNREGTIDDTGTQSTTYGSDIKNTLSGTNDQTNDLTVSNSGTQTTDSNNTLTRDLKGTSQVKNSNNSNDHTVNSVSDYPQANLNNKGTSPSFSWDYASGLNESTTTTNGNSDSNTESTNTGTEGTNGTNTVTNDLQTKTTGGTTSTIKNESDTNTTGDSKTTNDLNKTIKDIEASNGTISESIKTNRGILTEFDRLLKLLDYMDKNPYNPIFKVIEKLEKNFISTYIDEDRDGYIDPDVDLLKVIINNNIILGEG